MRDNARIKVFLRNKKELSSKESISQATWNEIFNFCGVQRHSDLNASLNIRRIAVSADAAMGIVNCPNVATA